MPTRPHILVTNDDGIHAPGIRHLCQALHAIADLTVVAPAVEQSAVGLSVTIRNPLLIEELDWGEGCSAWSVSGTPADCVKLGLSVVVDRPIHLIVSGINRGTNAGRNVLYSGTVAGAIEGVMHGIPAIAFSCYDMHNPDYSSSEPYIKEIVEYLLQNPLPEGALLNVNFPTKEGLGFKGCKMTRQGRELWMENPDKRFHPIQGHAYYWLGAKLKEFEEEEDCDISWLKKGYITAVPLHVAELTDFSHLKAQRADFEAKMG